MAFKEIADLSADTTISLGGTNRKTGKKNPTSVEGYYLGFRSVTDKKKQSGTSNIYFFQTAQGNVGVWGKTDMDRKLVTAPTGAMIRVSFDRMVPTPNGEMYKYKVEVDSDNSIEVAAQSVGSNNSDSDDTADSSEGDFTGGIEERQDEDEALLDAAQAAALAAAERKARVQALLNGNGKQAKG